MKDLIVNTILNNAVFKDLSKYPFICFRGSIAHGTYDEKTSDDIDVFGVVIPPKEYILGLCNFDAQELILDNVDLLIYGFRKYLNLLIGCNPNVVLSLFCKPEHYILMNDTGRLLIENRNLFLSKKGVFKTFGGYANGEMKKMTTKTRKSGMSRQADIDMFGYSPRNASHLIRLLTMGIEILKTGEVIVFRENDRGKLMEIKRGEWALDKIEKHALDLFTQFNDAMDKSTLPNKVDIDKINELCIGILKKQLLCK